MASNVEIKWPLVYVVVLHYNNLADTTECLESLLCSDYVRLKILVVDNGSANDSLAALKTRFPGLEFLANGRNLGFAAGNNVGIRYALERNADYLLLSNNDVVVAPDAIRQMVTQAEADPGIGAVAPKILEYQRPEVISFAGGRIKFWRAAPYHLGQGEPDRGQYDQVSTCDYLTGAFLLIRRSVLETVGLLPEEYFMYWEDVDWSLSVRKKIFKLIYEPNAIVYHKISGSITVMNYQKVKFIIGGGFKLILKHIKGWRLFSATIFHSMLSLRLLTGMLLRKIGIND